MQGEISYDLIMEDDMDFVEGCYRLPHKPWEVFIFSKSRRIAEPAHRFFTWDSGVTGITFHVPDSTRLNKTLVEELLSSVLGVVRWDEVRGPDSIVIR